MIRSVCLRRFVQLLLSVVVAIAIAAVPAFAQEESAPVVLDGSPLFRVAPSAELTAVERADTIQRELRSLVSTYDSFDVRLAVRNEVPTIFINDQYLMSVTQADADIADLASTLELASRWEEDIKAALQQSLLEREDSFVVRSLIMSVVVMAAALLVHRLLGLAWRQRVKPMVASITAFGNQGQSTPLTGLNLLLRILLFLLRASIWLGAVYYVTNLLPLTRALSYTLTSGLVEGLLARSLSLGERNYSVLDLFVLMALLLALVILASAVTNFIKSRFLQITGIDRGSQEAIAVLAKYTLIFLGGVVILQIWGLDLSSLALLASALGVGIGLGLQNIAKDFVSGLIMVFERPVQVGDFVDFGSFLGTVERIGARSTEIRTLDYISIIVPNSRFLEQEVINWSHRNPVSRLRLPVGVTYTADPKDVRKALLDACRRNPAIPILSSPEPKVFFTGFGDSALEFELLVWINQPSKQIVIRSDLYFAIEESLKAYGIEIPYPQRDVHLELTPETQQLLQHLSQVDGSSRHTS